MGSKRETNLALFSTLLLLLVDLASSDLNQDKAECTDKLIPLADCLPFVTGQAKAPAIDCCTGVKQVVEKNKRCLCILIKDRDNPDLGFKINVTLTLKLPGICTTPTNLSECVDILHLAPKSPEAKMFEGLEKALEKNSTAPAPSAKGATAAAGGPAGKETSTSAEDKNGGGWGKKWLVTEVLCGILPFVFISHFLLV